MQQRSHSCLPNILPRAAKQNGTILIRISFKDGHHEDKTFEVFEAENARDCVITILRPSKTATDRITRYVCDGRVVLAGRQHSNCILDNRPPGPGLHPVSKYVSSFDAVFQAQNKTFLSLRQVGCEQERKQMHTIHVSREHSAKLDTLAYACGVSVEIGGLRGMVSFVLSALHWPSALTRCQRHAFNA